MVTERQTKPNRHLQVQQNSVVEGYFFLVRHKQLGSCGDKPGKCLLCAGPHQASNHQCGVNGCSKKPRKLCTHVLARCANCMGNHQANFVRWSARQKAELQAQKGKMRKDPKILEKANNLQLQEDKGDEDGC